MKDIKKVMQELKTLVNQGCDEDNKRVEELVSWLNAHKEGHEAEIDMLMAEWLTNLEDEVEELKQESLREQMSEEIYRMLPLSIIAKKYFGKSASWLSQRINGTKVRGQVYTLTNEQKEVFNRATREIGEKIGSFRLA